MGFDALPESWRSTLEPVLASPRLQALGAFLEAEEAAGKRIYPPAGKRFRALELTALDDVKVVILGQDPYHREGQADGLAFSVPRGVRPPPSLANIFRELSADCGVDRPASGNLDGWARQGVLLLNTCLTVEAGRAGSHAGLGWEGVAASCLEAVVARSRPVVLILWGSHAQRVGETIAKGRDPTIRILTAPHPSPLSAYRGFFGSQPFTQTNAFLITHGVSPISWKR